MKEGFFPQKPKISNQEAEYKKQQSNVDNLAIKIENNLNCREGELVEQDRIRLTRVLQLIDRYKPDTRIFPEQEKKLIDILKELYRFLPIRGKKQKVAFEKLNDNPYLLAEETIESLRKLRHLDYALKNFSEESLNENQILKQEVSGNVMSSDILDTSLTLEYEKKNWGLHRICLDGIQNHLKTDSGGENVWVQCLIDDRWVDLNEAKNQKEKIKKIRFVDDGVGFDVKNLVLFWSSKSEEEESRGQFGEGLKMVAASSVRENLDMELQSQNWSARPFSKEIEVNNTRKNTTQKVGQLSFKVSHHKQEEIIGSRTIFHQPNKDFIEEVLKLKDTVLELDKEYKPLFRYMGNYDGGDIVSKEAGNIFVKGIFVKKENTLFSYNFEGVETNRDRNTIVNKNIRDNIQNILIELNDKRLIKTLLQKGQVNMNAMECNFHYLDPQYPSLWKEAFYEAFGENACLGTNFEVPEIFNKENDKLRKVKITNSMFEVLKRCGVKTDKEALPSYQETIPTSVTLEYGKDIWKEERIMLDAIQNHLPQDTEGGSFYLRFKTKDGQWHSFYDFKYKDYSDEEIETIKIANSGSMGYDSRLLGIFQSMKDHEQSSGKWGEGLKMLSAACLRGDIDLTLKSRNWKASPRIQEQNIDGKNIQQLVFNVVHDLRSKKDVEDKQGNDYNSQYEQSATIFNNPPAELIKEFRNADKKVLELTKKTNLFNTSEGEILGLQDGELFVRGILIPGEHNLKYSYHLNKFDIKTRDRNNISKEDLIKEMSKIWLEVDSPAVIKDFLYQAGLSVKNQSNEKFLEFQTFFNPKNPDIWIKTYKEIFGKSTAVRNVNSEDFNVLHQLEHIGLSVVTMPNRISQMLQSLVGSDGEKIADYQDKIKDITDVKLIEDEDITTQEKEMIEFLYKLDQFLSNTGKHQIKLYDRKFEGQDVVPGFFGRGGKIHLLREVLLNKLEAVYVYYHEKTHAITGATDAEAGFRNFLTMALAELALKQIENNDLNN
jgi:hypothetical protein